MRFLPRSPAVFDYRRHSLLRANVVIFASLAVAVLISGFTPTIPLIRATRWQILPFIGGLAGMVETARCIRPRWGLYHATVVLLLYMDLMILTLLGILLVYPYLH
jgi:hypothetical protein